MKHFRHSLIAAAAASLIGLAPAAHAQWVVIDPTNLAQNILTAANTLNRSTTRLSSCRTRRSR